MKNKLIFLLPIALLMLLFFLLRGGNDEFELAPQKDGQYLFGEQASEVAHEIEYLDENEVSLTKENFVYEDDLKFEMSALLNEEVNLTIQKVNVTEPFDGALVNAYDFKTNEALEGMITISIPYSGEIAGAGYFNEETNNWEPVMHSVDTENNMVIIYTNHLSIYASFSIENKGTRNAYIKSGLFEADDLLLKYRDSYASVVKEAMENQMTPQGEAYDLGKGIVDDWMTASGAIFTLEGVAYSSSYLSDLSDMMGNVGSAMVLAQIAIDYSRGDEQTLAVNTWKSALNYAVSTWGSKALQVSFIGVTAIDYSINKLADELISGRQDLWTKAYMAYYKENNVRSGRDWYNRIKQIMSTANNPEQFERMINNELDNYTYLFWHENDDVLAFYQSEVMSQGFTGGGGLNDSLKEEIADLYKTQLLRNYLVPIFRQVEKDLQLEMYQEYQNNLNELRESLNQKISFEIIDESKDFAGYIVKLADLDEEINERDWTGTLNDDGNLKASFTVLGHLSAGAPNKVELYKNVREYRKGNPEHTVEFVIEVPSTKVYIDGKVESSENSFNITNTVNICPGGYGSYCEKYDQEIINTLTLRANGKFIGDIKKIDTEIASGDNYDEGSLVVTLTGYKGELIHLQASLTVSPGSSTGSFEDTSPLKRDCSFVLEYEGLEKAIGGGGEISSETNDSVNFESQYFSGDLGPNGGVLAVVGSSAQTKSICKKDGNETEGKLFSFHNGPKIYIIVKYE